MMSANITLNLPPVIEFGAGKIATLVDHLQGSSKVFLLVDKPLLAKIAPLAGVIEKSGGEVFLSTEVVPEPPIDTLTALLKTVRSFNPDAVVGIGGGSTMDLAKLLAVLSTGKQQVHEVIGVNKLGKRATRLVLASTTSGTGSEVTPIAVLTDSGEKLKKGIVSPHLVADVTIVDPELTMGLPAQVTAATGMDALTHCIEAYTNRFAHPIVDHFALQGIRLISGNLETAVLDGDRLEARAAMSLGSLYGGLCLGPVNTAAVHALAYPLGGEFNVPHGVANAVLLPFVMDFNLPACTEKYAQLARVMGVTSPGPPDVVAQAGIRKIRQLSQRCGVPAGLRQMGIPESAIPSLAKAAMQVTRLLGNNPRTLHLHDAQTLFTAAFNGSAA
jgi:alcohol dehydrogenase class IV